MPVTINEFEVHDPTPAATPEGDQRRPAPAGDPSEALSAWARACAVRRDRLRAD